MLVGLDGRPLHAGPTCNEFTIQRINEELGRLSELLHVRWMPMAAPRPGGGREGRYAFCSYWAESDGRRQWVRDGTYAPQDAFDILGWACEDIFQASSAPVPPEQCLSRITEMLYHCDNTRFPWRRRMTEVIEHNKRQREQVRRDTVDELHDAAVDSYYHSNRAKRFFMPSTSPQEAGNAEEADTD